MMPPGPPSMDRQTVRQAAADSDREIHYQADCHAAQISRRLDGNGERRTSRTLSAINSPSPTAESMISMVVVPGCTVISPSDRQFSKPGSVLVGRNR